MKYFVFIAFFSYKPFSVKAQHQVIPLKGSYTKFPYVINTSQSYDEVWSNIVHLLQASDMAGKILDKSTGVVVAQLTDALLTDEDKKTEVDSSAWAVVEKIYDVPTNKLYYAKAGTVEWSISVKSNDGKMIVSIDSINVKATTEIHGFDYIVGFKTVKDYQTHFESTGKFEKMLELKLK
jgi:hypothetical protein